MMIRARFYVNDEDWRPVKWPPPGPCWNTGYGEDYAIVVAYVDTEEQILEFWPDAREIDIHASGVEPQFSARFPKPEWWQTKRGDRMMAHSSEIDRAEIERRFNHGVEFPYDENRNGESASLRAARAVLSDLKSRRGFRGGFDDVDEETRDEIVSTAAKLIAFGMSERTMDDTDEKEVRHVMSSAEHLAEDIGALPFTPARALAMRLLKLVAQELQKELDTPE